MFRPLDYGDDVLEVIASVIDAQVDGPWALRAQPVELPALFVNPGN